MEKDTSTSDVCRLSDLCTGEAAKVLYIDNSEMQQALQERLADYGIRSGEILTCAYAGIWGDPTAYIAESNQTVVAIRRREAQTIWVQRRPPNGDIDRSRGEKIEQTE